MLFDANRENYGEADLPDASDRPVDLLRAESAREGPKPPARERSATSNSAARFVYGKRTLPLEGRASALRLEGRDVARCRWPFMREILRARSVDVDSRLQRRSPDGPSRRHARTSGVSDLTYNDVARLRVCRLRHDHSSSVGERRHRTVALDALEQ